MTTTENFTLLSMIYDLYTKQWEEDAVALFAMSKVAKRLYDAMELSMSEGSLPAEVMKAVNMYIVKNTKIFNEACLSANETSLFTDKANTVDDNVNMTTEPKTMRPVYPLTRPTLLTKRTTKQKLFPNLFELCFVINSSVLFCGACVDLVCIGQQR